MKKLVQILLIMAPVILMAQKGQNEKMFTHTMQLETSKENLWNVLVDFSSHGDWDDNIIDVRCDEGVKKRSTCKTVVNGGQIYDMEITDFVENETYTLRHKLSSGQIYIKRTIVAGEELKLTETVWYKGISKKTFEKYKGAQYQETLKNRMLSLKKYIE